MKQEDLLDEELYDIYHGGREKMRGVKGEMIKKFRAADLVGRDIIPHEPDIVTEPIVIKREDIIADVDMDVLKKGTFLTAEDTDETE